MIKKTSGILCALMAGLIPLAKIQAEPIQVLGLKAYLEETLQRHLTQQEHRAMGKAEAISLRDGQRYFWPDITARTSYDEETSETLLSPSSRTLRSGVTTGLDTSWTSWLGTDLTLGLEHQYGRQLGQLNQGIPEDDLQAHNLSVEISQPLLRNNSPFISRLPLLRAQKQWEQYQIEGELSRLTLLKDAMLDFLAVQESHDRLQLELHRLEHIRTLAAATSTLVEEGRSLTIDRDLAELDVLRQEHSVANAQLSLRQNQSALTLAWVQGTPIEVRPMASTADLINALLPIRGKQPFTSDHPEYRSQQLRLESAQLEERARARDRWPDVSAYYRYEKNFRESLPDEESQAWGIRFSYTLFDLPTREQQARLGAEATIARWSVEDQRKRLQWESDRLLQSTAARLSELTLHDHALALSQRAVDHELARFREGLSSYSDVQNREQDLQERLSSALNTRVELARELIDLAYHHQWDWLNRLP